MLKLGIIGDPIKHSLSPALHRFLMRLLSIEGSYEAFPTSANELGPQLARFQQEGYRGLNVTIPHKVTVMEWVDHLSEEARLVQAVNTLTFEAPGRSGRQIYGHNTDIAGFMDSLPPHVKADLSNRPVLILGTGGACRAVLTALIRRKTPVITLAARNPDTALETLNLGRKLVRHYDTPTGLGLADIQDLKSLENFRLVVNATPIGLSHSSANDTPLSERLLRTLPNNAYVFDLVYGKAPTRLVRESRGTGLEAQDGLKMLVTQGVIAFELWSGQTVRPEVSTAALQHLREALS